MKPIMLNDQIKQQLLSRFNNYLQDLRMDNQTINFSMNVDVPMQNATRPKLIINPTAYLKMLLYVCDTQTEIAWHGTVTRNKNTFTIHDVFLYPQTLSAATVTTDQENYNKWCEELDDETYNTLRFQGHSHVNFGATPSGTDLGYYRDMLKVLPKNDFYIFMILNKSRQYSMFIYDLASNTIYETADIDVIISETSQDIIKTITAEKEKYCVKPIPQWSNSSWNSANFRQNPYINTSPYPKSDLQELDYRAPIDDIFDEIDEKYKNKKLALVKPKNARKKKGV